MANFDEDEKPEQDSSGAEFSKILSLGTRKALGKKEVKRVGGDAESITVEVKKRKIFPRLGVRLKPSQFFKPSGGLQSELVSKINLIKSASERQEQAKKEKEADEIKAAQGQEVSTVNEAEQLEKKEEDPKEQDPIPSQNIALEEVAKPSKQREPVFTKAPLSKVKESDEEKKPGIKDLIKSKHGFGGRRDSNRIIVQNVDLNDEEGGGLRRRGSGRGKKRKLIVQVQSKEKVAREIILPEFITVAELASRMAEKGADVVKKFMEMGMVITLHQTVDADTAELVVNELGHTAKRITDADVENILEDASNESEEQVRRPPVVTVMGHIDHGKTSLLDALRETDVISGEAGGITQHIGAYQVQLKNKEKITFIDTPGHAVFTAMRMRGAQSTDIVILVVAADDGIKDQTIEAISHAKAAKVPIIVAINKMDKVGADPQRVINDLLTHDVLPESMGGDVMTVEISALKKQNLDKLEEAILFQAEMLELKARVKGRARGVVVESKVDKNKGPLATLLVQKGTIKKGDIVAAGCSFGKVRTMSDYRGMLMKEATPAMPVEVTGFETTPAAGEGFAVVQEEKQARDICDYRIKKLREEKAAKKEKVSLEDLFSQGKAGQKELCVVIKGDVQGSVEAIANSLDKLSTDKIKLKVIHKAVGGVNESDITLAKSSKAIVLGFNVGATTEARSMARMEGIEIKNYSIIYNLVDDIRQLMEGKLDAVRREQFIGKAEVRQVFNVSKVGKVAGAFVTEGVIKRNAHVKLLRDNIIIYEGLLKTLKRFKDDVKEAAHGYECGIMLEKYDDLKEGDVIDAYEVTEEKGKL